MKIGEWFIRENLLTQQQLGVALKEQKNCYRPLGKILLDYEMITSKSLYDALVYQWQCDSVDLEKQIIDKNLSYILPKKLMREKCVFPYQKRKETIYIATDDIHDPDIARQIKEACPNNIKIKLMFSETNKIQEAIQKYSSHLEKNEEESIVEKLEEVIDAACIQDASDIHFEPQRQGLIIRYRIDGVLCYHKIMHIDEWKQFCVRIKVLSELDISEKRRSQEGQFQYDYFGEKIDVRVSFQPILYGERLVMRLLKNKQSVLSFTGMGLNQAEKQLWEKLFKQPHGLIVLSGPTGSGKTTSLYAAVEYLKDESKNIMTLEDPIEYEVKGVSQTMIKKDLGIDFVTGMKSILRQDPDVILIGEIRDKETAEIALKAAMTGHSVLTTLHSNTARGVIPRLLHMGVEPYLITDTVRTVINQRLLRKVCDECQSRRSDDCPMCSGIGYKGRVLIYEYMDKLSNIEILSFMNHKSNQEISGINRCEISLEEYAKEKIKANVTTQDELVRVLGE